ncbi:MAG: hypothetical protein U9P90_01615, partial [Patescibacteria group bacterium]|nr:hypothetical protein [Patescibacteria group bacterium]
AVVVFAVAKEYKVRYWKAFFVFLVESVLLSVSFFYFTPYLAITVCALCLFGACAIVGKKMLVLYLTNNPPKEIPLVQTGYPYHGQHKQDTSFTESLQDSIHRWLYNKLVPKTSLDIDKEIQHFEQAKAT